MNDGAQDASAARLFVLLVGAALVVGGIAGFFYEPSFSTGGDLVADDILGIFPTNGWDNVFHLIAGVACLASASRGARAMALAIGGLFTLLALWGLIATDSVGDLLDVVPVSTEDNLLHLAVGLTGLAAGLASPASPPAARA